MFNYYIQLTFNNKKTLEVINYLKGYNKTVSKNCLNVLDLNSSVWVNG